MFKLNTFHYDDATGVYTKMPHASIIESATLNENLSGYEVIINFSMRWPTIDSRGGSSGGGIAPTKSVTFTHEKEGYEGMHYSIEWEIPEKFRYKHYALFPEVEKNQAVIYFVDYGYLESKGASIVEFHNPDLKIRTELHDTFDKLGINKEEECL